MIDPEDKKIITIVDTVDEAFAIIKEKCKGRDRSVLLTNGNDKNEQEPKENVE